MMQDWQVMGPMKLQGKYRLVVHLVPSYGNRRKADDFAIFLTADQIKELQGVLNEAGTKVDGKRSRNRSRPYGNRQHGTTTRRNGN